MNEKRQQRNKDLEDLLSKNYYATFIKGAEKAVNKKFAVGEIKKIKLEYLLNKVIKVVLLDKNGNTIENKEIEKKIKDYCDMKKKALDSNSDRYYKDRSKKPNMVQNLINRSLGEEYFNY